jgi:hypothetical protein
MIICSNRHEVRSGPTRELWFLDGFGPDQPEQLVTLRRTEFTAFVLDLMDFIEEKIMEALENEPSRFAAIGESAGAIPVLSDQLRERFPDNGAERRGRRHPSEGDARDPDDARRGRDLDDRAGRRSPQAATAAA